MCDSRNYNPDNYIHVEIESNEDKDHNSSDEGEAMRFYAREERRQRRRRLRCDLVLQTNIGH